MARIIYPTSFEKQANLFEGIYTKHVADGPDSVLLPLFVQQLIDPDADLTRIIRGRVQNELFTTLSAESTDMTQDCYNIWDSVFSHYRQGVQFLKAFFKGNVRELQNWTIPVDNKGQINYPSDFMERVKLVRAFYRRNNVLGGASPLIPFLTLHTEGGEIVPIDPAQETSSTEEAVLLYKKMLKTKKDAEEHREQRDLLFAPVLDHIHTIGDFLKKLFVHNPHKLGEWGFVIDDSPREAKQRIVRILPKEIKTIIGIKLGSTFSNTGTVELNIYKGKAAQGQTILLAPEDTYIILRGWGTITVQNKDKKVEGEVSYFSTKIGA